MMDTCRDCLYLIFGECHETGLPASEDDDACEDMIDTRTLTIVAGENLQREN